MLFIQPAYASSGEHSEPLITLFGKLEINSVTTTMWGLIIVIAVLSYFATRNVKKIPESRLQNFMEFALEGLLKFFGQVMGSEKIAKRYLPFLASFFILILCSNYSGLLPGAGLELPGLQPPTSTWSVTAGFAIVVFLATHYYGVKKKGLKYFKHFIEPIPVLLPLNILEELVKPLSLSLRLYGNIFGEEMVVAGLFALLPLFLPLPMQLLGLLFGFIQALVFTMLASIYISTATADH
ncbi:MAG: F0F1 ATP synthase subunit A [Clostridia bacterium]|nr:F0F1 ATP synthase subunit A [Clostridia bacterium]MDD4048251.1 F0F1 ATP synthase subunit A [Clostridia bacterium]